jgi:hypothetical protein
VAWIIFVLFQVVGALCAAAGDCTAQSKAGHSSESAKPRMHRTQMNYTGPQKKVLPSLEATPLAWFVEMTVYVVQL